MNEEKEISLIKESDDYYIDEQGCHWESPKNWLWTGVLGGCGCGSGDEIEERVFKTLKLFGTDHKDRSWSVYDDLSYEIIAHWMDHEGLLEHGTSVASSWLNEKGKKVYNVIKSLVGEEGEG